MQQSRFCLRCCQINQMKIKMTYPGSEECRNRFSRLYCASGDGLREDIREHRVRSTEKCR